MRGDTCLYFLSQVYNICMQQIPKVYQNRTTQMVFFFQDGVRDGRQNLCLLIEHMHMLYGQFRCTYTVYLVVILHVTSIHHIKYFFILCNLTYIGPVKR